MNATYPTNPKQCLSLRGPCAGCDAKTPTRGSMAMVTPGMDPGEAAWQCPPCTAAVSLPWNAALRRRIDRSVAQHMHRPGVRCTVGQAIDLTVPAEFADMVLDGLQVHGAR